MSKVWVTLSENLSLREETIKLCLKEKLNGWFKITRKPNLQSWRKRNEKYLKYQILLYDLIRTIIIYKHRSIKLLLSYGTFNYPYHSSTLLPYFSLFLTLSKTFLVNHNIYVLSVTSVLHQSYPHLQIGKTDFFSF